MRVTIPSCYNLISYRQRVHNLYYTLPYEDRSALDAVDKGDPRRLPPSQLLAGASVYDHVATEMRQMWESGIPAVARDFHRALTDYFSVRANVLTALATSGRFGAMAYTDVIDEIDRELMLSDAIGQQACGERGVTDLGTLRNVGSDEDD